MALVAVGGYGRGSLCPYSDLDVVLVHIGHRDIKAVADGIWYPVWDEGVHLDHSVRRPAEVLAAAAEDARVALGLLDGRMVWGEPKVADPLLVKAKEAWRNRLGTKYLPLLEVQMQRRRDASGDVAFLLEPDLKESHGGLRDVGVLRAISEYAPLLADYADLASLSGATELLTTIRVELHRIAGRAHDRLLLQDQDQVAAALGLPDADDLMAAVADAGRQIAWVSDDVWRRRRLWDPTPPPRHRFRRGQHREPAPEQRAELGPDMVLVDGEVALTPLAPVTEDASLALRLAATAAQLDRPIAKASLYRLADVMPPIRATRGRLRPAGPRRAARPRSPRHRQGRVPRPARPPGATHPGVGRRAQQTAAQRLPHATRSTGTCSKPPPMRPSLTDRVERPDLLLVGALLHDIGKGFPGDHTTVGMEVVERITTRMGFPPEDVAVLVDLVRYHLLLPGHGDPARPRRPDHHLPSRPGRRRSGHPSPPGRADRGGQPGHRAVGLGTVEGRAGGRPGRARRQAAPRRGRRQPPSGTR